MLILLEVLTIFAVVFVISVILFFLKKKTYSTFLSVQKFLSHDLLAD